jgi:hypothetical protein
VVVVKIVLIRRELNRHVVLFEILGRSGAGPWRRVAFEALGVGKRLAFGAHEPPQVQLASVRVGCAVGHNVPLTGHR